MSSPDDEFLEEDEDNELPADEERRKNEERQREIEDERGNVYGDGCQSPYSKGEPDEAEAYPDEILDVDYLPALMQGLWTIFVNERDPYERMKQGLIRTNHLLEHLKSKWFDYRHYSHKRNQFIQKLEMEVQHYKSKKLNPDFVLFFSSCKSVLIDFIRDIRNEVGIKEPLSLKPGITSFKSFAEIFYDENIINPCIDLLKKVKQPIVDENMNYLLGPRKKASIAAWVDVVLKGKTQTINRQVMSRLLNDEIKGLNLGADGKTLTSIKTTTSLVYIEYQNKFARLID